MNKRVSLSAWSLVFSATVATALHAAPEEPYLFQAESGQEVEALKGEFSVPENRAEPKSRKIRIGYVRFPATGENLGPPIVYLAGGPGGTGTGTAAGRRFPLFMALREFGDVIAFDQRGTGLSDDTPPCVSSVTIPDDRRVARAEKKTLLRRSVEECGDYWQGQGIDYRGYTTLESARDLEALRAHLGAEKLTLWGISYGTHLALAAAREMGPRLDRLILASVEGLDQTVKLPARTDAYFDRLQTVIDAYPAAKAAYPDVKRLMRRVIARLDEEPALVSLPGADGGETDFLIDGEIMRRAASAMISDPERARVLLQIVTAADAGVYEPMAALLAQFVKPGAPERWRVMPLAMDIASGIDDARLAQVEAQAQTAILGDTLNYPMPQLRGALGLDLGNAFRAAPASDIPTLMLTGTLDGRTYPQSQKEALAGFTNVTAVTVENAGHNLFMVSPEVTDVIAAFMRGESIADRTIRIDPPSFAGQ